ncbi:MAG: hypothetical protein HY657_18675 [Acidobacteria bacterium]|nr:hypothetical protein [Acidobacteriota bacterium]
MKPSSMIAAIALAITLASCAGATPRLQHAPDQPWAARAASPDARAVEPLTMTLSAHVVPEPAQVVARVRVEPDPRSRELWIEWWTPDGVGGSHLITLEGDRAATRHDYPIKRLESGEYVVRALLARDDGSRVKREARLIVVGKGSPPVFAGF